jgi:hypothetical protein
MILHVVPGKGGWSVKFALQDAPSVLIEQKQDALAVAQRIASRHEHPTILLYEKDGSPPRSIGLRKRRKKLLSSLYDIRS